MRPLLIFALAFTLQVAHAQTMFKCVSVGGKTSYSDQPCSGKVAVNKELDVRANLEDAEREARRKAALLTRERDEQAYQARVSNSAADPSAVKPESDKPVEAPAPRRATTYAEIKADTAQRVQADEEARAKASALWKCKRGPEPEKCV
jgi:Skp family chaperone for outer membrane proteins